MFRRIAYLFAALGLVLAACSGGENSGSLVALIDPEGDTSGFGDFTTGRDKSFGIFICSEDGSVEIEGVEPATIEGGIEYLGAQVYTSEDMFVGAANRFPPDGIDPEKLQEAEGAIVDKDCEDPEGTDRIQLIVGAERTSVGGGQIVGLNVDTSDGTIFVDYTILLCGDELEFCEFLLEDQ